MLRRNVLSSARLNGSLAGPPAQTNRSGVDPSRSSPGRGSGLRLRGMDCVEPEDRAPEEIVGQPLLGVGLLSGLLPIAGSEFQDSTLGPRGLFDIHQPWSSSATTSASFAGGGGAAAEAIVFASCKLPKSTSPSKRGRRAGIRRQAALADPPRVPPKPTDHSFKPFKRGTRPSFAEGLRSMCILPIRLSTWIPNK